MDSIVETLISNVSNLTTIRYQHTNHLDSASLELDETGNIITYEEYHPFGTTSYRSGRNEIDVSLKRYKYVHKELDNETGLYYYGMRYYASWIARFISVDPLQFKYPHYTPFKYAGNKPISFIDLDGAEEEPAEKVFFQGEWIEQIPPWFGEGAEKDQTGEWIETLQYSDDDKIKNISFAFDSTAETLGTIEDSVIWRHHSYPGFLRTEMLFANFPMSDLSKQGEFVMPKSNLFIGAATAGTTGFGIAKYNIRNSMNGGNATNGYWEDEIFLIDKGFQITSELGIEIVTASGGSINFSKSYLNSEKTNSLSTLLNKPSLTSGSMQFMIKYTKLTGVYNDEDAYNSNLLGFGFGGGLAGSKSVNLEWKTKDIDSLKKATEGVLSGYKGEFELFLLKKYGVTYLDSISK